MAAVSAVRFASRTISGLFSNGTYTTLINSDIGWKISGNRSPSSQFHMLQSRPSLFIPQSIVIRAEYRRRLCSAENADALADAQLKKSVDGLAEKFSEAMVHLEDAVSELQNRWHNTV